MAKIIDIPVQTELEKAVISKTAQIKNQYSQLGRIFNDLVGFVWANQQGHSPQEVLNAFGTKAADLFLLSNAFVQFLSVYDGTEPSVVPAGWTYEINQDGTITLTEPQESSSSN